MGHELIFSWLGLPPGDWPPDHYRLLGLAPGESDEERIERHVHQRLDSVRRYQLTHPEQATEAMNRLAQAFVCLTDPVAKKLYDSSLLGTVTETAEPALTAETVAEGREALSWLYNPPPVRSEGAPAETLPEPPVAASFLVPPPVRINPSPPAPEPAPAAPDAAAAPAEPAARPEAAPTTVEPLDPLQEAAQRSTPARRGLGTKRALYYRVARTRQLLRLWTQIGRYLANPKRRLTRNSEAKDLVFNLGQIRTLLRSFPPLLGEAGQPGYLVLALEQMASVATFQALTGSQREALSRDWKAGAKLLTFHRDYLRQELRAMRKRTWSDRLVRYVRYAVTDQPGVVLLLLALLALNVAAWRSWHLDQPQPRPATNSGSEPHNPPASER